MSSPTGGPRLVLRHVRSGRGPSVLVAVVVAITSFLALAAPLALTRLADADLHDRLAALTDADRGLTTSSDRFPFRLGPGGSPAPPGDTRSVWDPITSEIRYRVGRLPHPLRDAAGTPIYSDSTSYQAVTNKPAALVASVALYADPDLDSRVRWVSGSAPVLGSLPGSNADGTPTLPPVQVGLSTTVASAFRASVGTVLSRSPEDQPYVVSGIFRPRDPSALFWRVQPRLLHPGAQPTTNGTYPVALAVVSPRSPGLFGLIADNGPDVLIPLRADAWTAAEGRRVEHQIAALSSEGLVLGGDDPSLLTSSTPTAIDAARASSAALSSVSQLAAAGPFGVALLIVGLGIGSVLGRRRPAIRIASARGGTALAIRTAVAAEGALVGIPAALIGAVVAPLVIPAAIPWGGVPICVVLALAPAAIGFAAAAPGRDSATRTDLGAIRPPRWRPPLEASVIVLAAALSVTLLLRGPGQDATRLDPLLLISPLLLALAAGVVALRIYPLALRAAQRALHRGRRAAGFLGVARGVREPTVGLAAALAILTAVTVAALAATVYASVDAGTRTAARSETGADIRAQVGLSSLTHVPRVRGAQTIAVLAQQSSAEIDYRPVGVVTATTEALHRIRSDVPAGLDRLRDGAVPILVSDALADPIGQRLELSGHSAVVVGRITDDADFGPVAGWILVDRSLASRVVDTSSRPTLLLADVDPGASVRTVAARFRAALPHSSTVTDAETAYDDIRASPAIGGLAGVLAVASLIATGLSVLAAVMAVVAATRRRDRTVALLRVLGLSLRQNRRMLTAELAPIAIVLTVIGIALGVGLGALVLHAIDLRPFTTGTLPPPVAVAPVPLAIVGVGFLVVAGAAAAIATHASSRVRPADVIRTGD